METNELELAVVESDARWADLVRSLAIEEDDGLRLFGVIGAENAAAMVECGFDCITSCNDGCCAGAC